MYQTEHRPRLNDIFTGWRTGQGIFSALQEYTVPWAGENIAALLDLEYHGNVSGDKYISPLVLKMLDGDALTDLERDTIAHVIISICGVNWNKEYATMELVYNPIENYSMTEKMTDDKTVDEYGKTHTRTDDLTHGKTGTETRTPNMTETRTDDLTHGKTGTETQTPNTTETQTPDLTNTSENTVHGFNSSVGIPTGEQTQKATGMQTIARTGTDTTEYNTQDTETGTQTTTRSGTDTVEYNTQDKDTGTVTDNDGGTDTRTRNYELTRAGNIGVTTSQQMVESERSLWLWNFFRDVVFPDVDKILTLQIY